MRRSVALVGVVTAFALFLAGFVAGTYLDAAPAAAKESIVVIEHATTDAVVDLGEEGDTAGDTLVFSNELFDADNANVVGTSAGSCVRTVVGKAWECTWSNTLENGSLTAQGTFYDTGDGTFAITGGTGDYSGATGEMKLKKHNEEGTEYEFAFEIN
jgi:hypothetical protein